MAIYSLSIDPISRSSGRSAVAAAAYRAGVRLVNARDAREHDYGDRRGVVHTEIVLPAGADAWARDRQRLWDTAEAAEKRKDARVAREVLAAMPHELTAEQRLELARELAAHIAARYGVAVDFAVHEPSRTGDGRNHHAHLLMTTRRVERDGLGEKSEIELSDKALRAAGKPVGAEQVLALRQDWELLLSHALARAGHEVTVDCRSHAARGIELAPTTHVGVTSTQMEKRGKAPDRRRLDQEAAAHNARLIREKPDQVLELITGEKAVFDRRDIARVLNRHLDGAQEFQNAFATVMASSALVQLQPERADPRTGKITPARYSTREMIDIERGMADAAASLHQERNHGVAEKHVTRAIAAQNADIQRAAGDASAGLSHEQVRAITHATGPERIATVVGFAGAGKSTMLSAARAAWEADGYSVFGAALAATAAANLRSSSGIASRTIASWERSWAAGRGLPQRGDVFVVDEAGMVSSRQMARVIATLQKHGAKVVLVGDHEQLQAIGAGAAFRGIAERVGHVTLADIRRQRVDWQRRASVDFARHRTAQALGTYHHHGHIQFGAGRDEARAALVRDYLADRAARPGGSRVAMAHRLQDVSAINAAIRSALQARGELAEEIAVATDNGLRSFAAGDRIIFLENNAALSVKNGTLGTIEQVAPGRLVARLDDGDETITIDTETYQAFDHGYCATIHKNQGATVDRAFVLASRTMDRHLAYVSMTRHRDQAGLYAAQDDFRDFHDLSRRLGRAGTKETTLDYLGYAERRGIVRTMESEIVTTDQVGQKAADVAVERARPRLVKLARVAFSDGDQVADQFARALAREGDANRIETQLRSDPEAFGPVRGGRGLFGENEERRAARRAIGELANEVLKVGRAAERERTNAKAIYDRREAPAPAELSAQDLPLDRRHNVERELSW